MATSACASRLFGLIASCLSSGTLGVSAIVNDELVGLIVCAVVMLVNTAIASLSGEVFWLRVVTLQDQRLRAMIEGTTASCDTERLVKLQQGAVRDVLNARVSIATAWPRTRDDE